MELVSHDDRATGRPGHAAHADGADVSLGAAVHRGSLSGDGAAAALRAADVLAAPARAARGVDRRTARGAGRGAGRGLVGLSFDDGYADFAEYALPVLRRYGFTATVFVIAGRMGGDNADAAGPRKPLLDADQVAGLAEAGVEIGSHGLMHVSLPAAHRALAAETGGSRRILQDVTGQPAADSATRTAISTPRWSARSATRVTTTAAPSGRPSTPAGTRCRGPSSATPTARPGSGPRRCGTGWPGPGRPEYPAPCVGCLPLLSDPGELSGWHSRSPVQEFARRSGDFA